MKPFEIYNPDGERDLLTPLRKIREIGIRRTLRGENIKTPITYEQLKQGVKLTWNARKGLWE